MNLDWHDPQHPCLDATDLQPDTITLPVPGHALPPTLAVKHDREWCCQRHRRIYQMKIDSRHRGKLVPTDCWFERNVPNPLICSHCHQSMTWTELEGTGASKVITIQHDRNGAFRLICQVCNSRHAAHPHDTFFEIPPDKKFCASCQQILSLKKFSKEPNRGRWKGLRAYCKQCSVRRNSQWRKRNLIRVAAYARIWRKRQCRKGEENARS